MRAFALVLVALAGLGLLGCKRKDAPVQVQTQTLPLAAALPLFDDDVRDPYNELHRVVFGEQKKIKFTGCGASGDCLDAPARPIMNGEAVEMPAYRDHEIVTVTSTTDAIRARTEAITALLPRIKAIDPTSRAIAAVLLQRDLWMVFDAEPKLRPLFKELIHALALPATVLASLKVPAAETDGFVEIIAHESEPPFAPPTATTTHARIRGLRSVFRRFVKTSAVAADVPALLRQRDIRLPTGSIAMMVEHPIAIAREGHLVVLEMITLAERRTVRDLPPDPHLGDLGFEVFEGTRQSLRKKQLTPLAPGAAFPSLGTCGIDSGQLVPMRAACILCHQQRGDAIRSFAHGEAVFSIATPGEAAAAVVDAKSKSPEFQALKN